MNVPHRKFWGSEDQYSKDKVSGDLETLRSFYQNQGLLDFNITSNQVSISPEKDGIFLTVNIDEGERYTVSSARFSASACSFRAITRNQHHN